MLLPIAVFIAASSRAYAAHALSLLGEPKYPLDFQHFDYVNPNANKAGELNLALISLNSNFDKFNPFSIKGVAAPGLLELLFETLTINSLDETNTQYGLLADDIQLSDDLRSVTFRLHEQARFANGDRITADDVIHSFLLLSGKFANPRYRSYFSEIAQAVKIDARHVRFEFRRAGRDISFIAGSLPVFSRQWSGAAETFGQRRFELPIASGPYQIDSFRQGRHISYKRRADYWGRDIPSQKGSFNFETVTYKIYKDKDTQVAALRAGEFDVHTESAMRYWCCQYVGKRFDSGELVKQLFSHQNPPAMNGWVANLRRERFRDPRIRQALNYALDFEWINEKIFDDQFKRITSYFSNTPLAASGLPGPAELALLEPWRDQLPEAVFGPMFVQPSTRVPGLSHEQAIRHNLEQALKLFAEAGWHFRDGALRNARGEQFRIEFSDRRVQHPYTSPIYQNLRKLGIDVSVRVADQATERARMKNFEFDYRTVNLRESRIPGDELWRQFNSADADRTGSENYAGVKSAAVDHLIQTLMNAESEEQQQTAAKALDRVLIHSHYFIPWRYLTDHYVIYHQRLKQPDILPRYYTATEWALRTWWQE